MICEETHVQIGSEWFKKTGNKCKHGKDLVYGDDPKFINDDLTIYSYLRYCPECEREANEDEDFKYITIDISMDDTHDDVLEKIKESIPDKYKIERP